MGNLDPKKMAGYTLILGPILALVCFFIQPGGVLQIGGSAEPLDYAGQMKISSDNSGLGIITGILVPVGLITLFSGIMFYIQSMEGGNGFGLARIGLPFFLIATAGWTLASSIFIGFSLISSAQPNNKITNNKIVKFFIQNITILHYV